MTSRILVGCVYFEDRLCTDVFCIQDYVYIFKHRYMY